MMIAVCGSRWCSEKTTTVVGREALAVRQGGPKKNTTGMIARTIKGKQKPGKNPEESSTLNETLHPNSFQRA
jgi:hypothetical protein